MSVQKQMAAVTSSSPSSSSSKSSGIDETIVRLYKLIDAKDDLLAKEVQKRKDQQREMEEMINEKMEEVERLKKELDELRAMLSTVSTMGHIQRTATPIATQNSTIYGFCAVCEAAVPVRVSRRCNRCHTEAIAGEKDGNWNELNGAYRGCQHTIAGTRCESKTWEFVGICYRHPNKLPDRHCPLLPGVIANTEQLPCDVCKAVHPTVHRWDCGHFLCLPKCYRDYIRTKLDNRELLVNTPTKDYDATYACPLGCRAYIKSHNCFKMLGKARYQQYQTLGMESMIGRLLTPESTDGRQKLVNKIPDPIITRSCPDKKCGHEVNRTIHDLNNHIICRCGKEWCWQCEDTWKETCQYNHLIGIIFPGPSTPPSSRVIPNYPIR